MATAGFHRLPAAATLAAALLLLPACGGGGGGSDEVMLGDEARRAVLADLGEQVILPLLTDFAAKAQELEQALDAHAAEPQDAPARAAAQAAWRAAAGVFEGIEVLQLGPAAMSDAPGGEDLRELIYAYPRRNDCVVDRAAYNGDAVNAQTRVDAMGLGALEHLLFSSEALPDCPPDEGVDMQAARASYAAAIGAFIADQAQLLSGRWDPQQGNFLAQWSRAGLDSQTYMKPQDALDALSTALFYVEKETKDRKIACPTGIGATGLSCPGSQASRAEFFLSRHSAAALRANVQLFRDVFAGRDQGMGMNDLLRGIERDDIADKILAQLDATLNHLDTQIGGDFEAAVEAIDSQEACINAASARQGEPAACALHGLLKAAMDTFRSEVVAALSLATPDRAAGDND